MASATENFTSEVPRHVAIIMDGNGRWAKAQGLSRLEGHKQGVITVLNTIEVAEELGVKYLTLYTFSTENWRRPEEEVVGIMDLLVTSIELYTPEMMKKGVRLKFIGDRSSLSDAVQKSMANIESQTAENNKITVIPAVNYGSRDELTQAMKKIALKVSNGELDINSINQQLISDNLYTAGIPDPDLLIRTSGELRLSNFLLWQLSYAEFYITETLWPDFSKDEFIRAIQILQSRKRRFGGL